MNNQNHNSTCEEARPYYYDCLCEDNCGLIPQSISSHIEQCRQCQKQVSQLKVIFSQKDCIKSQQGQNSSAVTTMLQLHFAYIGEHVTCETVRPFLPGLLDPAIEIRVPTPITAHLDNCPQCAEDLKAIQQLNLNSTQLYGLSQFFVKGPSRETAEFSEMAPSVTAMAQRADSEIITVYHIDESANARKAGKPDDLYFGFPISVEVIEQKVDFEEPVPNIKFAAALKEKISAMNLRPFLLKIGVAAAAVIGFALLFNTPSAKAVSLQQIYKAIKFVNNVHILKSEPDETKLLTNITEEKWISRTLDISMSKTVQGFVFWDVSNRQIQSKPSEAGEIKTGLLADDEITGIKQTISGSLGLMPFTDISQIPPGSQWQRVDDESLEVAEGFEIYDLKWASRKYSGSTEFKIWRYLVDPKTNLPKRIDIFRKSTADGEYNLMSMIEVKYLTDSEIQKVIEDAKF